MVLFIYHLCLILLWLVFLYFWFSLLFYLSFREIFYRPIIFVDFEVTWLRLNCFATRFKVTQAFWWDFRILGGYTRVTQNYNSGQNYNAGPNYVSAGQSDVIRWLSADYPLSVHFLSGLIRFLPIRLTDWSDSSGSHLYREEADAKRRIKKGLTPEPYLYEIPKPGERFEYIVVENDSSQRWGIKWSIQR